MPLCIGCNQDKPESEYYRKGTAIAKRCKPCYREQVYAWRKANPEKAKLSNKLSRARRDPEERQAAWRRYYERNREKIIGGVMRGRLKYPDKATAREILTAWIRTGRILRPARCTVCGEKSDRIEGHHPDYSLPLAVIWCCRKCHEALDKEAGR